MKAEVVICGAGIAGVSAAYCLAARRNVRGVVLVDERPPLSLTSDKSTECYRNWWPGPGDAMVRLMNHSLDLLESLASATGNRFHMGRHGYLYVTRESARASAWLRQAEEISRLGAGPLRRNGQPAGEYEAGADLIDAPDRIRREYPWLTPDAHTVLAVTRCGWLSAQQLGMTLLDAARDAGARLMTGRVEAIEMRGGHVASVRLQTPDGAQTIETPCVVDAAGPYAGDVAGFAGIDLPIRWEVHRKVAFQDSYGVVPRDAPLIIGADPQTLGWTEEEQALLAESAETQPLLGRLPSGVHLRPEGGPGSRMVLLLWPYRLDPGPPAFPIPEDPILLEVALRGMTTFVPGLDVYLRHPPRGVQDAGYYTRTPENRPLIGRTEVEGFFLLGALSGFGIMASQAAADLLAAEVCGETPPIDPRWFALSRYRDPEYQRLLASWDDEGQL